MKTIIAENLKIISCCLSNKKCYVKYLNRSNVIEVE